MNIHILGIAGTMTAPLAVALKKLGHNITGSDQEKIFPPISTLLESAKISINQPLGEIDLCIVGSSFKSFSKCISEFEYIKKKNINYISATEYLAKNLIKTNSILVAGSYGKTTITALLAHIKPDTNYFYGGQSIDDKDSLHFIENDWSIVEADESINGLDTQAKFLYYPVKYLILTSVNWEHKESYSTSLDNFNAFKKLVENVPKDGALIYNSNDSELNKLLTYCKAKTIPYYPDNFETFLIGKHNQENISAVFTLLKYLGENENHILAQIKSFKGIKRRLEVVSSKRNIIIDDFAQSAHRVLAAIEAVKFNYPHNRIIVYFEPHATFLQKKDSLQGFNKIVPLIDKFILGKIKFSSNKFDRVQMLDWKSQIGEKLIYEPINENIVKYLKSYLMEKDILIHFSSGGLDGLKTLKTVYNNT